MKRIITAIILIPLVLLLVFKAPLWAIALATCIVALLAMHEYLHIVRQYGVEPSKLLTYGLTVALFIAAFVGMLPTRHSWSLIVLSLSPFLFLTGAMRRDSLREGLSSSVYSSFGLIYVALALTTLVWIRAEGDGVFWIVVLFATVWAGDSVAMYVGKAFGRHKLAPRVSPNKTWEGSIGSVIGSLFFSLIALHYRWFIISSDRPMRASAGVEGWESFVPPAPLVINFVLLVIILNIAGQLGDLVESVIKRGADVKDSGSLLPGHGGILDRIDALLFAAPVLWYYLIITRA